MKEFAALKRKLAPDELSFDLEVRKKHSGDKWFAVAVPDVVAFPKNAKSVSTILAFANKNKIPVTARGAGYGYVGGCVPTRGGIVISLMRLNRIKDINVDDFVAVVEPGVLKIGRAHV